MPKEVDDVKDKLAAARHDLRDKLAKAAARRTRTGPTGHYFYNKGLANQRGRFDWVAQCYGPVEGLPAAAGYGAVLRCSYVGNTEEWRLYVHFPIPVHCSTIRGMLNDMGCQVIYLNGCKQIDVDSAWANPLFVTYKNE